MSEIEIDYKPKVFDDPEYCENVDGAVVCGWVTVKDGKTFCGLLKEYLEGYKKIKCSQCKEAYQRAKNHYTPDMRYWKPEKVK